MKITLDKRRMRLSLDSRFFYLNVN